MINLDGIPQEIKLSTITITCAFNTNLNIRNIRKYIPKIILFKNQTPTNLNTKKYKKKIKKRLVFITRPP